MAKHIRLMLALAAVAQGTVLLSQESVRVTPTGKEMYFCPGRWSQIQPQLINTTDSDLPMQLDCRASQPQTQTRIFSAAADVPAGWIRRVDLAVRPSAGRLDPDPEVPLQMTYDVLQAATGQQLFSQERQVSGFLRLQKENTIVWVLQDPELIQSYDSHNYLAPRGDQSGVLGQSQLPVARLPGSAPDRWWGYDSADIILCQPAKMTSFRGTQFQALLDWVSRGGVLVLAGGPHLPELLSGPLGDISGVTALGSCMIRTLQVDQIEPVDLPMAMPLTTLSPHGAEVLARANDQPLLTRKRYGAGTVFVLSVPTLALGDEKLRDQWYPVRRAMSLHRPIDVSQLVGSTTDSTSPGWQALRAIAGRPAPPASVPVLILLCTALGVLFGGLLLRRRRRGELVWVLLVPLALAGAVAAWMWGTSQTDQPRLTTLAVLAGMAEGPASLQELHACYSGPEPLEVDVTSGHANATILPLGQADAITQPRWRFGRAMFLPDQLIPTNATRSYLSRISMSMEGIDGQLQFNQNGLLGQVVNQLGSELTDCVLYYNRRTFPVGTLEPGQSASFAIAPEFRATKVRFFRPRDAAAYAEGDFTGKAVQLTIDAMHNELVGRLLAVPGNNASVENTPILIGYVERSWLDPLAGLDVSRRADGVVFWPMEFAAPAPGQAVAIPFGLTDVDLSRASGFVWNPALEEFNRTTRPVDLVIAVRPPDGGVLQDATASLRIQLENALTLRLVVEGLIGGSRQGRGEVIETINAPSTHVIEIDQADRFRNEVGEFVFRIRVQQPSEDVSVAEGANWTFRRIEAALKGTTVE